uniref:Uncharacterized protein n=1 Tax=Anguilla anguilla TaxID=7936 RepID=A0A0E9UXJ1_ANGAN
MFCIQLDTYCKYVIAH